jgi:hypothetical protein
LSSFCKSSWTIFVDQTEHLREIKSTILNKSLRETQGIFDFSQSLKDGGVNFCCMFSPSPFTQTDSLFFAQKGKKKIKMLDQDEIAAESDHESDHTLVNIRSPTLCIDHLLFNFPSCNYDDHIFCACISLRK